jgi:hypothetical protein
MSQFLLSTYALDGEVPGAPGSPEEMRAFMERVMALEAEMDAGGAFVYGGALLGPEAASVVRPRAGDRVITTDGPFVESKEQIGGFYSRRGRRSRGGARLGAEGRRGHQPSDRGQALPRRFLGTGWRGPQMPSVAGHVGR